LVGPAFQVAAGLGFVAQVGFDFLENVLQRGWLGAILGYGEAEAVGLAWFVVGVLAEDDHLDGVEGTAVEGIEDVFACGKDGALGVSRLDKGRQG